MVHTCNICNCVFEALRGLNIHYVACKRKELKSIRHVNNATIEVITDEQNVEIETSTILEADVLTIETDNILLANISNYIPDEPYPNKDWHDTTGLQFTQTIDNIYDEIVHWRKNLFKLPSGTAGRSFISFLTNWLDHFNRGTEFCRIALKVFMVLPCLLLQKTSRQSKSKDHSKKLEERQPWNEGRIDELMRENRKIQKSLVKSTNRTLEGSSHNFTKLMWQGKVSAALKLLNSDYDNGVLKVDDNVFKGLQEKHPKPAPIKERSLLQGPINKVPASYWDAIDKSMIATATRLTKGSGGPSQLDAEQFRHIILSKNF